jgi:hypothetical protein
VRHYARDEREQQMKTIGRRTYGLLVAALLGLIETKATTHLWSDK